QWVDLAESIALHVAERLGVRIAEEERRVWRMTVPSTEAGATRFAHAVNLEIREAPGAERESAWRDVLADDPQCGMAHGSLIRLLSEAQRKSECRQASDEFLRQQPDLCYAHLAHAWMLGTDGEVAAAETALREALRLHPGCPEATERMFDVLATTGRWADLVSVLEGTLDRRPDDEPARAFLAAALAQTGKLAEARDLLKPIAEPPEESELVDLALLQAALGVGDIELAGLELQRLGPKTATNLQIRSTLDSTKLIIRGPANGLPAPTVARPHAFTPEELNTELERRLTPEEQKLGVNPLEITPELAAEARRLTTGLTNDALRSFALFAEVCRRGRGSGDGGQRTASQAFTDSRDPETRFSCQEHAKLFVALARAIGLEAWLAHVERGADGLSAYHDCAALFLEGQGLLVDPAWSVFGVRHKEFTVLDDLQAISHQAMQPHPQPDPRSLRMGLKLNPDDRWTRLQFVRGMAQAGKLDAADRVLQQVESGGTETWDVHDAAAVLAIGRDQWRRALADLQRALESSPSNVVVHLRLAGVFAELGDPLKSAHHMDKALALNRGEISKETWREHQFGVEVMNAFSQARSGSTGSIETLERRAQAGDLPAQMAMAKACFETRPPRTDEGMRWLKKAAEQGDPQAQFHYARNLLLVRGQSAIADSMQWLTRSAEQGHDDAQYQLGLLLYEGELAPRDNVVGAQWVYLAADQGHVEARRLLKEMQIMLKPEEMTEARQRADAFKPVKQRDTPP
ncbi:MAG TPA: BTAD domain-containing putative transcriptional regulator, partial [Verrucomicrobiota bacterium]|nr:BTAD domain-containing putative transcriptional regulator [Verrucomicrobiota bacterium]